MRSTSRKTPSGGKLTPNQLLVHCGSENAIFDISLYGPGGSSRCVQFGEHVITPIEFEALAGKKCVNWKLNIKVDGKPIRTVFESGTIKSCERSCKCDNCETGRKHPSNLELLIEKVYMKRPEFDLKIVKIEKEDKDVKSKRKVSEPKSKKEANKKVTPKADISQIKSPKKVQEKDTNGKDTNSVDGVAPLNDVRDEFCSSPDPSPRKKRSSIETPVDEILGKAETELKETPTSVRTRRASKKVLESTPINPITAADFDLNKEVAPLVNMPDERIIPDEMAPIAIKQDPEMVRRRQQADIRSFFSPPAKEGTEPKRAGLTNPSTETSPAQSDCSIQLLEETEIIKKVLEVDLTESPNKSVNTSLQNSVATTPEPENNEDTAKKPRQITKRSPPSITKETLVRHTRGLRLQDRTEIIKQKHQQQREESVGKDKKVIETEPTRSGRSSRQISTATEPQVNGKVIEHQKEVKRVRRNDQVKKDLDKTPVESTPMEMQKDSINSKKSTEDDELLKMLKEEKSLCLSPAPRKRVLREANKSEGDEEVKVISEIKPIQAQRRIKRKLSEQGITAELEKSSPVPDKKDQEPPNKRQRRMQKDENSVSDKSKVQDIVMPTATARRTSKEEKENANTIHAPLNGVVENKEAEPAARKARKSSKEDQPPVNPSNDLNKVPVTSKQNKEADSDIKMVEVKELNDKKELTVIEPEIPKPTFIEVENSIVVNDNVPLSKEEIKEEVEEIKPKMNGVNGFNDNKISPNKLPTYTTMIKSALDEMNVPGGEGCSKLEILLYILRKFRPKGNVNTITTKLIKILEVGTKKGDFLSSVSCPRVLKKTADGKKDVKDGDSKKEIKPKEKEKMKKIKTKDGKIIKVKVSKLKKKEKVGKDKEKVKDKVKDKKEKRVVVQSPRKLKEPLSIICKAKKLTRHEVIRKIWAYIHAKKLQDPADKTIINCDENLKKLTKLKQISQKNLMSYIKPFMEPIK